MDLGLAGKVALVTGGSRSIGREIVHRLALEGAQVVTCARDSARLGAVIAEFGRAGLLVSGQVCDVRDSRQVEALMDTIHQRFGGLDLLVNNASYGFRMTAARADEDNRRCSSDPSLLLQGAARLFGLAVASPYRG